MKKKETIFIALFLLVSPLVCSAQETGDPGFEVRLGMGAVPQRATTLLTHGADLDVFSGEKSGQDFLLSSVYHDYNSEVRSTNSLGADVMFHTNGSWDVGCGLYVNHLWYDRISGVTGEKTDRHRAAAVYLIPTYRRYYLRREMVCLYGQFSIGFAKYFSFDELKYAYYDFSGDLQRYDGSLRVVAEVVPFGIEIGKEWFGFAEVGTGGLYKGVCIGGGYKF